jgi:cysteine-rich repeat protein
MSPTARLLLLLAPLPALAACKPTCADNEVGNKHGYNCTPLADDSSESTAVTTSDSTSTSTSADSSSTATSTGTPPPCDDDPACGPDESVATCPAQCSECGDGQVTATELCDNGNNNQTYWPTTPPDGACSDTCTTTLEWCGDATQNGDEPCDNGTNNDAPYSATVPPDTACAPNCTPVAFCGDRLQNGPEPCDTAAQTSTCELDCRTPTCGDNTLNTLAGEACDDGNTSDGDGCSADCKSNERLVFVTSLNFKGDLNKAQDNPQQLSSLALADFRCQTLATKAALPGTYKAWLSTDTDSPSTRLDTSFTGLYRLPSQGFPIVANGWAALTSGTLEHPINADETGALTEENVFTNTLPDGTSASNLDCAHWSAKDDTTTTIGKSSATNSTWTNSLGGQACSNSLRLYCFQDL